MSYFRLFNLKSRYVLVSLALFGLGGGIAPAMANVECGDTITGSMQLNKDLICPKANPVLTLEGGASLDMNGHKLICAGSRSDLQVGVMIEGIGAELHSGAITRCAVGVQVAGVQVGEQVLGKHSVVNITALANDDGGGFAIQSDANYIANNVADGNDTGFDVTGSFNILSENKAVRNSDRGFDLEEGVHGNLLYKNTAIDNQDDGFKIRGSGNVITHNKAISNAKEGFVAEGQDSIFFANIARRNTDNGLKTDGGQGNQLIRNKAVRNGANGISIDNDSSDNKLVFNRAFRNQQSGIVAAAGSSDNTISRSTAFRNSRSSNVMFFDLLDENGDCDHNTWKGNAAGSADPSCTRGE